MVASHHVDAGNQTRVLYQNNVLLTANPTLYFMEEKSKAWNGGMSGESYWSGALLKKHGLEEKPLDSICETLACEFEVCTSGKPLFSGLGAHPFSHLGFVTTV